MFYTKYYKTVFYFKEFKSIFNSGKVLQNKSTASKDSFLISTFLEYILEYLKSPCI